MKHDIPLGTSEIFGVDMRRRQAGISADYVSLGGVVVGDITSYFKHRAFDAMVEVIDGRVVSTRGSEQLLGRVLTILG